MTKPTNPVAVVLWCMAAVFIVGDVPLALVIRELAESAAQGQSFRWAHAFIVFNVWSETRSALLGGGQLIAFGVLIELVDQIRWNALPAEKQVVRHRVRDAIRRVRRIGMKVEAPGER